jgi:hypothetical protein
MKPIFATACAATTIILLAACAPDYAAMTEAEKELLRGNDTIAAGFGDAHHRNMAIHIIDPVPDNVREDPTFDGRVILGGYGRYRTGEVRQPQAIGRVGLGTGSRGR